MQARDTVRLIAALAHKPARAATSLELARHLGGQALFVFVPHPDNATKLIPAPGFATTMPSSRGWRAVLAQAETPGTYTGTVAFPTAAEDAPAVTYAYEGIAFVVIGGREINVEAHNQVELVAPLIAALLSSETQCVAARGELAVANQAAQHAGTLTRALDLARGQAVNAARAKDDFLAMLGHELRNPLAPILSALQLLRVEGIHTRIQDVLERQVANVMRLVDDLLDVSRITSGKIELRRQPMELAIAVTRAIEMARPMLESRHTDLVIEVPERGLCVDGDAMRLSQVVSNLIVNAAKYSDPRTRVCIRAERTGEAILLTVVDQGIGLAPDYIDHVFEQFSQLPQGIERSAGGLGLGLTIVRSLVGLHGGKVRASSAGLGQGSTFTVELPWCAVDAASDAAPERPSPVSQPRANARVLIVDDNRDAAELLGEMLATYGYRISIAYSGAEAIDGLSQFTPDVALLDIGLPIMDGYELAGLLRSAAPHTKLVALTGYGQAADRDRTRIAGFDVHLVKPVSIKNVTAELDRLLA